MYKLWGSFWPLLFPALSTTDRGPSLVILTWTVSPIVSLSLCCSLPWTSVKTELLSCLQHLPRPAHPSCNCYFPPTPIQPHKSSSGSPMPAVKNLTALWALRPWPTLPISNCLFPTPPSIHVLASQLLHSLSISLFTSPSLLPKGCHAFASDWTTTLGTFGHWPKCRQRAAEGPELSSVACGKCATVMM